MDDVNFKDIFGMPMQELSRKLGCSRCFIGKAFQKKSVSLEMLDKIISVLRKIADDNFIADWEAARRRWHRAYKVINFFEDMKKERLNGMHKCGRKRREDCYGKTK